MATAQKQSGYRRLQTLPGVGVILGLTIAMETGPISRFAGPGNYASYCRCVSSARTSNGKDKGRNNGKNGNRYLAWAFVEAANFARRLDSRCRRFFDRKKAATNSIVATKALACKLAKAAWWILHQEVDYDSQRMFPGDGGVSPPLEQARADRTAVRACGRHSCKGSESAVKRLKRGGEALSEVGSQRSKTPKKDRRGASNGLRAPGSPRFNREEPVRNLEDDEKVLEGSTKRREHWKGKKVSETK